MNIESLEINLFKASEIKDGDIVIVKIANDQKSKLDKENIKSLYKQITDMTKKEIPIYFFPANLDLQIIKNTIQMAQESTKQKET